MINVLLAAYNGESYVEQQISSILHQTIKPLKISINVDHSSDNTLKILHKIAQEHPEIEVLNSNKSFGSAAANFIHLISSVDLSNFDYIALADQDDLWNEDKLEKAIQKLEQGYDGYSSNVEAFWIDGKIRI